ncbi:BZIP domain-containing protein [Forsythia ovata]|uniref:BZIP domain-containing protein n=1 Tax=Forsythia ovata TaxID=205694 RepID=A0ABD1W4C1_9LAMI
MNNNRKTLMKNNTSMFGCSDLKRSPSELVLHELFASEDEKKTQQKVEILCGSDDDFFAVEDGGIFFPFKNSPRRALASKLTTVLDYNSLALVSDFSLGSQGNQQAKQFPRRIGLLIWIYLLLCGNSRCFHRGNSNYSGT